MFLLTALLRLKVVTAYIAAKSASNMTLGVEQMRNIVWSSRSSEQGDTVSVSLYVSLKQWIHRPADSTLPRAQGLTRLIHPILVSVG
jgi:hypothetical protein